MKCKKICLMCNNNFYVPERRKNVAKFCSYNCYWGYMKTDEFINKVQRNPERIRKIKNTLTGRRFSKETNEKRLKTLRSGVCKKTEKFKKRHKKIMKDFYKTKKGKESTLKTEETKRKRYSNGILKAINFPTSFEKEIIRIVDKHNLPFKYVGNYKFWIGRKNPDFICTDGRKFCLEVYNFYHHPDDYEVIRATHFIKYGWCTIFINEDELKDENFVVNKINTVLNFEERFNKSVS